MATLTADFSVNFDNFDLNTIPYLTFTRRYPNNEADLDITSHELIRTDGDVLTSVRHKAKTIALDGYILAPSRTAYEQTLDTLKARTSAIERPLVLLQSGQSRRYVATKENIVDEPIEGGKSHVNLTFRCSNPFGESSTQVVNTFNYSGNGGATIAIPHTFTGTATAKPVFVITISALTGGTSKYIGVGNSSTGQQVQVTRTWSAGDVVQFDLFQKTVFVNSAAVDFEGVFPEFAPGRANATYVDNLTTRTVSVRMVYTEQYL